MQHISQVSRCFWVNLLFSNQQKPIFALDYYKLRFQIEFNFRDAKQFWGLEDFMNLSQTAVTNAAKTRILYGQFIPSPSR